jgi:TonB-dependent receptor
MSNHTSTRKPQKDRTSFVISVVIHVVLIGGVVFWAWKSGKLEEMRQAVLQYVRSDKKEQKQEAKPIQQKAAPAAKLPPINQGMTPSSGGGTRRAVAADAPASAEGDSFFQDTRQQVDGASSGSGAPPPPPPPSRLLALKPPAKTSAPSAFAKENTKPSSVASILQARQKSSAAQDAISTEQISRSGASDAAAVVAKITGTSVADGKFVIVRGLSDRYNSTTLNGGEIPTADPYRKAAQLDLFPSSMIDRVVVSKTFTPDQPAGFAGGAVNIVTRSFPAAFNFRMSVGAEYNTASTFNDEFLTYSGGKSDWFGVDGGTRALPKELAAFKTPDDIPRPPFTTQTEAEEYKGLLNSFKSQQMGPIEDTAPMNRNFGLSIGDTLLLFGRRFGYSGSFSYDRKFWHLEGISSRYNPDTERAPVEPEVEKLYADTRSIDEVLWGGAVSLAYEVSPEHVLGFGFLYSQNAEDLARRRVGFSTPEQISGSENSLTYLNTLQWVERQVHAFQFKGQHQFPELANLKADWLASLANTSQEEPDLRMFNYKVFEDGTTDFGGSAGVPEPGFPTRYFRDLAEDNQTYRGDLALPLFDGDRQNAELKFGLYHNGSERHFEEQTFSYNRRLNETTTDPHAYPNEFLAPENLDYQAVTNRNGQVTYVFDRRLFSELGNSLYDGEQKIQAGYLMPDVQLAPWLRITGGVRYETTYLRVDSTARNVDDIFTGLIDEQDVLPAAAITSAFRQDMNLRLSFGQTVARPTYREFAPYESYDVTGDEIVMGNPNLVMSYIDNFDLRWEWFPHPGEILGVSAFYKQIQDPIEKIAADRSGNKTTFANFEEAIVYGLEFEARTTLGLLHPSLRPFSAGVNLALIESEVDNPALIAEEKERLGIEGETRPLYDQSPYVLNADLSYDNTRTGTRCSLVFYQAGERLYIVNPTGYDVYEQPTPMLDIVISQDLTRHLSVRFAAKNLLDPEFKRIYGREGELGGEYLYSSYKRGRSFSLALNYTF